MQVLRSAWQGWLAAVERRAAKATAAGRAILFWRAVQSRRAFVCWRERACKIAAAEDLKRRAVAKLLHSSLSKVVPPLSPALSRLVRHIICKSCNMSHQVEGQNVTNAR